MKDIFPAGLSVNLSNLDLEMTVDYFKKWNLQSEQMQRGKFAATVHTIHTPRIQFHDVNYSHGFLTKGEFPPDCIILAFVKTKVEVNYQNRVLALNELVIARSSDEIDFISNSENRIFTIAIEASFFNEAFYDYFSYSFEKDLERKKFFIEPLYINAFINSVHSKMRYIEEHQKLLNVHDKFDVLESEMLEELFGYLTMGPMVKKRAKFKVNQVRDILHENLYTMINNTKLVESLNISERQLERSFKSEYGITAKRYYLNLRMNAVRKELLFANEKDTDISSIILKYNFFDLAYFSKSYKLLFHELPSQTLRK